MVNTKKFSEFAAANLTTTTKKMAGISNSAGGENIIVDFTVTWTTSTRPAPPYDGLLGYNTDLKQYEYYDLSSLSWVQLADNAVFVDAKFIVQQPHASLPAAQALSALTTGILKSTTTTGVLSISAPLTSIDGLTTIADQMLYTTGANTYATTALTAFARTLLDDASAAAMRTTLGLGQAAVKNVTDNSKANVASVTGSFVVNHVLLAGDTAGTVKDGGSPAGMGTVLEVDTGTGLTGGPITTTGTISFASIAANSLWVNNTGGAAVPTETALAALTKVDDTNVTLTLGGTPATALINAVSLTLGWTGQLSLARGGTNASLTASNGGIVYSTATALAILSGTATANQVLLSGSSAAPAWSTATYPATTTINQLLYSSSNNTIAGLASANSSVLLTTSAGVPVMSGAMTNGQLIIGSTGATPAVASLTPGTNITITPGAGSITIDAVGAGVVPAALTRVDDTNVTLTLGGTPATALLQATSLTLGWTGQLAVARGGTALASITAHNLIIGNDAGTPALLAPSATSGIPLVSQGAAADPAYGTAVVAGGGTGNTTFTAYSVICAGTTATGAFQNVSGLGTSGFVLTSNGAGLLPTWQAAPGGTPAALTKTDDTNVTLTLGGTPATALLQATSLTLGWTGQLGLTRGGTAASLTASNGGIVYSTATALAILAGTATAGQILRSGASTTPSWSTATYPATAGTSGNFLRSDGTNFVSSGLASAYYTGTPTGTLTNSYNTATYPTQVTDTASAYSGGTYTVPTTGIYTIMASFSVTGTITAGNPTGIMIAKNGTGICSQTGRAAVNGGNGSFTSSTGITGVSLTAGDLITVKSYTVYTGPSYTGGLLDGSENMFSICQTS